MVLGRRWLSSQCKWLRAVPWATSSEASGETEWRWGLGVQGPADRRSCCLGVQLLMGPAGGDPTVSLVWPQTLRAKRVRGRQRSEATCLPAARCPDV